MEMNKMEAKREMRRMMVEKNVKKILCLATLVFLVLAINALILPVNASTTWRVPEDYETIQDAVNVALDGDIIKVSSGTYEPFEVDKSITISGAKRDNTIIEGSEYSSVIQINADNVKISGFTVRNGGTGVEIPASNNKLENNIFESNMHGIIIGGDNNIISNNIISNNEPFEHGRQTKSGYDAGGLFVHGKENQIIENIIENNDEQGIYLEGEGTTSDTTNNIIMKNEIINNDNGILLSGTSNNLIMENVINSCNSGIRLYSTSNNRIEYNTLKSNHCGITLNRADSNVIIGNVVDAQTEKYRGLELYDSPDNQIINNTIKFYPKGIYMSKSWSNQIFYNNLINNEIGLELSSGSFSNEIYHNNFMNGEEEQVRDDRSEREDNIWFSGGLGNYYSNWNSPDSDGDGIVDKPYAIPGEGKSVDRYPSAEQITAPPTPTPTPQIQTPTPTSIQKISTPTPTSVPAAEAPEEPGFEAVLAIAGLLAVAYLLRKRK